MPSKRIVSSVETVQFKRRRSQRVEKLKAFQSVKNEESEADLSVEIEQTTVKTENVDDDKLLGGEDALSAIENAISSYSAVKSGKSKVHTVKSQVGVKEEVRTRRSPRGKKTQIKREEDLDLTGISMCEGLHQGPMEPASLKNESSSPESESFKSETEVSFENELFVTENDNLTPPTEAGSPNAELELKPVVPISPVNGTSFSPVTPADLEEGQPKGWQDIYNEVVKMRARIFTPVDSMGCEKMPDTLSPKLSEKQPKLYRFQLLISLMLSSQTKDEINYEASQNMRNHFIAKGFEDGVCIEAVRASTEAELDTLIQRVGFHRRKAMYIKKACELLHEKHNDEIPKTIEEVVELPGVGPKMGHLLLQYGWGINSGIGVDVHIHRLAQKWHWVKKTDKPEVTRIELESWLPRRLWAEVNPLLVGFGQTVCNSQISNCDVCSLATKGLCKGVNRKLLKGPISEARLAKLRSQRGADLTPLLEAGLGW